MREADVQAAFVSHLLERGWDVLAKSPDPADVHAKRGAERLVAEVKGHTTDPGTDVDTMYGQLLRRMREEDRTADVRYAVVVPESMAVAATRVPGLGSSRPQHRRRTGGRLRAGALVRLACAPLPEGPVALGGPLGVHLA